MCGSAPPLAKGGPCGCFPSGISAPDNPAAAPCLQYGEEALKEGMGGGGGGGGMADLFEMMMGGGGRGRGGQRERKSEDVVHKLQVSLEDLYTGATK